MRLLLLSLLGITVVSGIILSGRGFGGGGRGRGSSSSSYSSEEHHGGRPHRPPRPPRGPRDPICDTEWLMFRRPSGIWCVKIFYGPGTKYSADNLCQAQGAVLSSLQNANERMQIANQGRVVMATHALGPGQVWLGGTRKPQCNQVNACSPLLTFDWTDGSATGTEGFAFPPQEPNMMVSPIYGRQDCISVLTSPADGQPASYGYPHGVTDDKFCTQTLHMYACGKAAR